MNKKLLFVGIGAILTTFVNGWMATRKHGEFDHIVQAIPIIRFEKFDETRSALIIGLFNPGALPMEISRTELSYKENNEIASAAFVIKEYGTKPLVLDPGDTILIPITKNIPVNLKTGRGSFWGQLDFRIPGQVDFYSLHHQFNDSQPPNPIDLKSKFER